MKYLPILLLFASLSLSCSSQPEETNDLLLYNQSGVSIELINLTDSRCPTKVTCVWEGDAEVFLKIITDSGEEMFTLHTNPSRAGQVSMSEHLGHKITLVDVLPYPETTQDSLALADYEIQLMVTQL